MIIPDPGGCSYPPTQEEFEKYRLRNLKSNKEPRSIITQFCLIKFVSEVIKTKGTKWEAVVRDMCLTESELIEIIKSDIKLYRTEFEKFVSRYRNENVYRYSNGHPDAIHLVEIVKTSPLKTLSYDLETKWDKLHPSTALLNGPLYPYECSSSPLYGMIKLEELLEGI